MKRAYWSLIAACMLVATSAPALAAPAQLVNASDPVASRPASAGSVSAKVEVEPAQTSELAFLIAAPTKEVKVHAGDQVKTGETLIVLNTPELDYAVMGAQAELDSAKLNAYLQTWTRQYQVWNGHKWIWTHGLPEVSRQADARVLQTQGKLDVAKANQAQGTLVAPFDATVASIDVEPGEMVEAQKTVLVLGDLTHLQIATTDLSEREIARVRLGQSATIRLKAFSQDLSGKVIAIAPMAGESDGDTVFKVTVQLDQQPEGLFWGMTGDIEIQTQ